MHSLELIPRRRLEYQPPGYCHDFGIGETLAALGLAGATAAPEVGAAGLAAAATAGEGLAGFGSAAAAAQIAAGGAAAGGGLSLGSIGTIASVGGTLLSAKGQMDQAKYQSDLAETEAEALRQKGNEDAAAGERAQITQDRRTQLALSRAQALAASSGTSATSPDIVNTEQQIAGQGEYNALSSLYEGQARARSDNYQADIDLFKGRRAAAAGPLAAGGTILAGLSSFASNRARLKYYSLGGYGAAGGAV